ncbi:hypothetical protein BH09PAT1_BH09PAT1_3590 [soil metagenome]
MKKLLNSTFLIPVIICVFSLPLILSFFHKGYFPSHDGEWAVVRLSDMYRELKDGQIPPRFSGNLNFSYGYPLFEFAYPLPYILGLPFFLFHVGLVNSIKILFALSVPMAGLSMYVAVKELWKTKNGALVSSILYMYLPYRLVDLYARGSLGESIASILFPLILYCMKRLSQRRSLATVILLGVAFASLILSHNIMAVLFGIVLLSYFIFLFFTEKRSLYIQIFVGLALGIGLSAFFWLPALVEKNTIFLSKIPIADRDLYYVSLPKLLLSPWGYGTPTESNPFTYQVGWGHLLVVGALLILFIQNYVKKIKVGGEVWLFIGLACLFVIMMFPISRPLWTLPLLKEINYPWTLLFPLGFLLSLLGGYLPGKGRAYDVLAGGIALISIFTVITLARPQLYVDRGDGFYFTNDATTTSSNELMPLTVQTIASARPLQKVFLRSGQGSVQLVLNKSQKQIFTAHLSGPSVIRLDTIYFPGWHWYTNGKELPISYDNPEGVMESQLPAGDYTIIAQLKSTPARIFANSLTILSLLVIVGMLGTLFLKENSRKQIN